MNRVSLSHNESGCGTGGGDYPSALGVPPEHDRSGDLSDGSGLDAQVFCAGKSMVGHRDLSDFWSLLPHRFHDRRRSGAKDKAFQEPADYMPLLSMGWVGYLLRFKELGAHPAVIFTLLFSNLALMGWRAIRREESQHPYGLGAFISFGLLSVWTVRFMTPNLAVLTAGLLSRALCLRVLRVGRSARRGIRKSAVEGIADHMPLATFGLVAFFLTIPTLGRTSVPHFLHDFYPGCDPRARVLFGKGSGSVMGLGRSSGSVFWRHGWCPS